MRPCEVGLFPLGPQHVLRKKVGYLTGVFYARNTGFVRAIYGHACMHIVCLAASSNHDTGGY